MRVLVVTTWFPSPRSPGAGSFVADDVRLLAESNEVTVLHLIPPSDAPSAPASEVRDGVRIVRSSMSPSRPDQLVRASQLIRRMLRDADLVHSMALSSLLPISLLRVTVPWVHTEHWSGLLAPETVPRLMRLTLPLTERGLARPDRVVAVSRTLARRISRVRSGEVAVIPNHVAATEERSTAPRSGSRIRLVAVGNLVPGKGPILAIQTLAELRRRGMDASLDWVGEGPLRESARQEAARTGVSEHVTFSGSVPKADVARHLQQADVFLLPTESETFGIAIAEALVAGTPVVVGARGGHTEFVTAPDGILVEERTPRSFADAVERLLALNRGRSQEDIGARAREAFSDASRARDYESVYRAARGAEGGVDGPVVDVIIAVHQLSRPIRRAVGSVLKNDVPLRVTVVCHNIASEDIAQRLGELTGDPRVRLLELHDGVPRPAGPFNEGLDHAGASFTSIMGSDDELEAGAIDSWVAIARRDGADAVIPRLAHAGGGVVPTPPTRPWRSRRLDLVKDRLSYRSAPLGLVSRQTFGDLRLDTAVATGEDVQYVTTVWSQAGAISLSRGPAYLVHADAASRTSLTARPVEEDLRFVHRLLTSATFRALAQGQRDAVVTKIIRVNVIGAIHNRRGSGWSQEDRRHLAAAIAALRSAAPRAEQPLPLVDRRLLDLAAVPSSSAEELDRLVERRQHRARPGSLLARGIASTLHREGGLRMSAASVLAATSLSRLRGRQR